MTGEAQLAELRLRHDAVLRRRQRRHLLTDAG
jgi:hypothetical protein